MDTDEKKNNLEEQSPEEQKAEEEALSEIKEEEIRSTLAKELDIDPEVDGELLDKLVERDLKSRKMTSGAIRQKINYRDQLKKITSDKKPDDTDDGKGGDSPKDKDDSDDSNESRDEHFLRRMEERDLKDLDLPEEIESEVKTLAKIKGISVREAIKQPYIVSLQAEFDKEKRLKDATPSRSNKGSYSSSNDPSKALDRTEFDFETEDGRKEWQEAKKARRDYLRKKE